MPRPSSFSSLITLQICHGNHSFPTFYHVIWIYWSFPYLQRWTMIGFNQSPYSEPLARVNDWLSDKQKPHAETMGGKEIFAGNFWGKKNTFSLSFLEVLLYDCDVWNGLQSWGVERWISGCEEPNDKVKTWKAKQDHGKKPGSGRIISGLD